MRLVRTATAAGAATLLTAVLTAGLTGCGAELGGFGFGDDSAALGDPIRIGTTDKVTSLDPAGAYDAGSWALIGSLHQSLLTFAPGSSEPVTDAAETCNFTSRELLAYRCTLTSGLTFSDGTPLTAADVVFSFRRTLRIKAPTGPASLLANLRSVEARGATVTFKLRTPDATWPYKIAGGAGAIVSREHYEPGKLRTGGGVTGSGPYELRDYGRGRSAELVRNGTYRGALKVRNKAVTVRYYGTPDRLAAAWQDRSVDVVSRDLPPMDYQGLDAAAPSQDGVRVFAGPGTSTRSLVFSLRDSSPMSEPAVRQAVAAIVDRQALAGEARMHTVDPLYSLIPRGIVGHSTAFADRWEKPDPGAARRLLAEAGVATPVSFTLGYDSGGGHRRETEQLVAQLERTGLFRVGLKPVPWEKFTAQAFGGGFDAFTLGWLPDFPDPDTYVASAVSAQNAYRNGYRNDEVTRLIRATQQESDRAGAVADFKAIDRAVARDAPVLPLWQAKDYTLATDRISGIEGLVDASGAWRIWELGRD
ncbi:ABC transporter substrate-binding protein [Streptomyces boninensis]|uniref:ABC transporter substrate-binding protein n=1 Tax=Streptomyces boninensis TaxID=2039455 RepID=UPI003B216D7A